MLSDAGPAYNPSTREAEAGGSEPSSTTQQVQGQEDLISLTHKVHKVKIINKMKLLFTVSHKAALDEFWLEIFRTELPTISEMSPNTLQPFYTTCLYKAVLALAVD